MSDESSTNGVPTPVTPKLSGLSLTEYASNPTPPGVRGEKTVPGHPRDWNIPDAFLLPNGYPDVRFFLNSSTWFVVHSNRLDFYEYSISG